MSELIIFILCSDRLFRFVHILELLIFSDYVLNIWLNSKAFSHARPLKGSADCRGALEGAPFLMFRSSSEGDLLLN